MPERMLTFGIFPFEKFDGGVGLDGAGEIPLLLIDRRGENFAGEPRRY